MKNAKGKRKFRYRSAVTGRFMTREQAHANKRESVVERLTPRPRRAKSC
jgi:hypothetical protein